MKTMASIYKDMSKHNYKIILNEARLNNTCYTTYDVKNIIGENIDYILPKNFYRKNIEDFVYDGKIMTLDKNVSRSKGALVCKAIIDDIIKR